MEILYRAGLATDQTRIYHTLLHFDIKDYKLLLILSQIRCDKLVVNLVFFLLHSVKLSLIDVIAMRIIRSSVNGAISLRHKLKNNLLGNLFARSISANYMRDLDFRNTFFRWTIFLEFESTCVYSIDSRVRARHAFERIALLIRRARQAAKCKPRIGWLFTRHYQVYQMLMRGEARYSSICLNSPSRTSLTPGRNLPSQISTIQFAVASCISASDLAAYPALSSDSFDILIRYSSRSIRIENVFRINSAMHESYIGFTRDSIKRNIEYVVQSNYLIFANQSPNSIKIIQFISYRIFCNKYRIKCIQIILMK